MTLDVNKRLTTILTEISHSNRSYAGAAGVVLESISEAREPIQLPQSVIELLGSSGVPDISPYDQADLLVLMDALAKTLLSIQQVPDTMPADDGKLAAYIVEYRQKFKYLTTEQIGSLYTRDAFDNVSPLRAYAMASVLSDIAADRRLQAPQVWQSIIENYIKLGE